MQEPVIFLEEHMTPIDINILRHSVRDIQFDIFLKLADQKFARIFSGKTGLDYKRLASYVTKGITHLYILKDDANAFKKLSATPAAKIYADPNTSPEQKIASLLNMTDQNISEIFSQFNISEETAQLTRNIIRSYVDLMAKTPTTLTAILKLVSHAEYLYYHSVATTIFGMFLARATGQFNQKMIELIGLGGFLHDIGCTQIPAHILMSKNELTSEQWAIIHTHPKLGLNMIATTQNIPEEVRYMVYQHHEEPSGHGYPNGIRGSVIYYPAKVVAIADSFSALISNRPFRPAYTIEDAIAIMERSVGKYDIDLIKLLSGLFLRPDRRAKS